MSKRTWVCFRCRQSARRVAEHDAEVLCPECGEVCSFLGYKIPIPPRRNVEAWEALRDRLFEAELRRRREELRAKVRRNHEIEKQIVELESRPENPERARLIRELRRELSED